MASGASVLSHLRPLLARLGVEVECGTGDAVSWLARRGAEAVTWGGEQGRSTILFLSESPTVSAVFEELAHVLQHRSQAHAQEDVRLMLCLREIEAKECLVVHRDELRIADSENEATMRQLETQRLTLSNLERQLQ
jgi:hypothetical protein